MRLSRREMTETADPAISKIEKRLAALSERPFAHRGLHEEGGPVENSLAAFQAAIDKGLGIELDVQPTAEGGAVVFHDAALDRLAEGSGPVAAHSMKALQNVRLRGSNERITTLQDALLFIGGRVPVLIEAKSDGKMAVPLALAVRRALEGYRGPLGVMSFDPTITRWFHDNFPDILNGLVVSEEEKEGARRSWRRSRLGRRLSVLHAQPKFLAYDVRSLPSSLAARFHRPGRRLFTWTVRSDADLRTAWKNAHQPIAEGFAIRALADGHAR